MRILKDRSATLIIDIQERLYPFIFENEKLTINVSKLIEGLKIIGIPIFITEQYVKGLGPTIEPVATLLGSHPRIEKMAFSCCDEPRVMEGIAVTGKENIIIAGIESHVCVLQTVLDLKRNGTIQLWWKIVFLPAMKMTRGWPLNGCARKVRS